LLFFYLCSAQYWNKGLLLNFKSLSPEKFQYLPKKTFDIKVSDTVMFIEYIFRLPDVWPSGKSSRSGRVA